jgi:hypothetical protein
MGDGWNVAIGGADGDTITSGLGNDLICGDHCNMTFTNPDVGEPWRLDNIITVVPNTTGGVLKAKAEKHDPDGCMLTLMSTSLSFRQSRLNPCSYLNRRRHYR